MGRTSSRPPDTHTTRGSPRGRTSSPFRTGSRRSRTTSSTSLRRTLGHSPPPERLFSRDPVERRLTESGNLKKSETPRIETEERDVTERDQIPGNTPSQWEERKREEVNGTSVHDYDPEAATTDTCLEFRDVLVSVLDVLRRPVAVEDDSLDVRFVVA